jgi:superfamily I DNA and/or RNA helicase
MHPDICEFASRRFYSGRLKNAQEVMGGARWKRFHRKPAFRPFVFHNISYGTQQRGSSRDGSTSYQNLEEIRYALALYQSIREQLSCLLARLPRPPMCR